MVDSFNTRFSLPMFVKQVQKLSDEQRNVVKKMGFGHLLVMHNQMLSRNLLVELMDRWSCEKKVFELPPGDVKIMGDDVVLILGLRVVGEPVVIKDEEPLCDLEGKYGATVEKRSITVVSLEKRLNSLGTTVDEDFIRTFLLFTFGTLLFPNSNGAVNSRYLSLLAELDNVPRFAWGEAVLENLFEWMDQRKKDSKIQYMGGCLIFLQIWSYEHIDIARPCSPECHVAFPRVCRWKNTSARNRLWFTTKFEELRASQIIWKLNLTSEELDLDLVKELPGAENEIMKLPSISHSFTSATGENVEDRKSGIISLRNHDNVSEDSVYIIEESPKMQGVILESRSTSELISTNIVGDESNVIALRLEEENVVLRKEVDTLRRENEILKMQDEDNLITLSLLKEKIEVLTNEIHDLRRVREGRYQSEVSLMDRLERILHE